MSKKFVKSAFNELRDPERLVKLIDNGQEEAAIQCLRDNPDFITHQTGKEKLSILQKSIYKSQLKLFEFVLKNRKVVPDCETLLHAIRCGKENLVLLLLDEIKKRKIDSKAPNSNSRYFEPYMTPLILACLKNNFEIVTILRAHGHSIEIPHRANCACPKCQVERKGGEDTISTEKRLATLRALSSQAYLLQNDYEDPILDGFMLSRELEKCHDLEPALANKYEEVKRDLNKIPESLIAQCSNDEQIRTILKNPIGSSKECSISLPRLRVALDMHNKQFIAEPKCQKVVMKEWYGDWADWPLVPPYVRSFRVLFHTLLFPVTSLMFVFSFGKFPSTCRIPFLRFLSFMSSHFFFLLSILINMQYKETRDQRGPPVLLIKQVLFAYVWLYVAGDFAITLTDIWRLGFRRFFDVWWRCYIIVVSLIYVLNFHAFCIAWVRVNEDKLPNMHRSHWPPNEPTLHFEILFAIASVISTWRMFYFLQLNRTIGPTVISIGRCVADVALYVIIMFSIIFSFAIGLNYLYEHYKYNTVIRNGVVVEQPYYLTSIATAMRYLYWSFYGYLDPDRMAIVVGSSGPDDTETFHNIVGTTGEFLCALYYGILVIVLLQLMVSMMTNTAGKIMEQEELEWKYYCTHLRSEYFEDSRSVPPPFCLLQLFINMSVFLVRKCFSRDKDRILSVWDWRYRDPEYTQQDYLKYNELMGILTEKVFAKQTKEANENKTKSNASWRPGSMLKR